MYKIINIKENQPECEYAVFLVEKEIEFAKKEGNNVLIVIHGYGSHGVGGKIKTEVRNRLNELKAKKKIVDFVAGEEWCDNNKSFEYICNLYPNLLINSQLKNLNPGVTVVLVF